MRWRRTPLSPGGSHGGDGQIVQDGDGGVEHDVKVRDGGGGRGGKLLERPPGPLAQAQAEGGRQVGNVELDDVQEAGGAGGGAGGRGGGGGGQVTPS